MYLENENNMESLNAYTLIYIYEIITKQNGPDRAKWRYST